MPLPVANGATTPRSRVVTPVIPIYFLPFFGGCSGPRFITGLGANLVSMYINTSNCWDSSTVNQCWVAGPKPYWSINHPQIHVSLKLLSSSRNAKDSIPAYCDAADYVPWLGISGRGPQTRGTPRPHKADPYHSRCANFCLLSMRNLCKKMQEFSWNFMIILWFHYPMETWPVLWNKDFLLPPTVGQWGQQTQGAKIVCPVKRLVSECINYHSLRSIPFPRVGLMVPIPSPQ